MRPVNAGKRARLRPLQIAMTAVGAVTLLAAAFLALGFGPIASRDNPSTAQGVLLAAGVDGPEVHYHPGRPAHIHSGSCSDLGEIAFPLNPVGAVEMTGAAMAGVTAMAIGETSGPSTAAPVEIGRITLDVPLAEIVVGDYALNVQISEFEYGNFIACGDVGGVVVAEILEFGLGEINDSGFTGLARLEADGEETRVTVYLMGGDG